MSRIFLIISSVILSLSVSAASIDTQVKSMFDSSYSNVTSPGEYKLQGASYYSLGSYSERNPVTRKKISLINITPPKVSAGCGGIDLQTGGFSMIDGDEFVDNLRNIGQNAKSLFFMLGLQLVTPTINDIMTKITNFQKEFLQFDLDSCAAATALVGGAMELAGAEGGECIIKRMESSGDDYAEAKQHCTTGMGRRGTLTGGAANKLQFTQGNILWFHMMQDDFYKNNLDYAVLIMNLLGTVVLTYSDNSADSGKDVIILPMAATTEGLTPVGKNIVHALLKGTSSNASEIRLRTCTDKTNSVKTCVKVGGYSDVPINWKGLMSYAQDLIVEINTGITNNTGLGNDALAFLSQTPVPLYRYILLERANNRNSPVASVNTEIVEKLALNHVYNGILTAVDVVRDRLGNSDISSSKGVAEYSKNLEVVVAAITKEQQKAIFEMKDLAALANHMLRLETEIKKRLSATTVSQMNWGVKG